METEGAALPASIEMAWGIRERPTRGPKRGLSLEQVVAAGVKVASADGIAALSMSRVAGELGTSAMSLYRYVASKDELLALMVDAAFEPHDPPEGLTWRAGLEWWARAEVAAYLANPWVVRVPVHGAPITPNALRLLETGLVFLKDTGLAEGEKMSVILLLTSYTRSWATLATDLGAAMAASTETALINLNYAAVLRRLTTPLEFPELTRVLDGGVFDDPGQAVEQEFLDEDFAFGLTTLLDGVEALVRSRAPE